MIQLTPSRPVPLLQAAASDLLTLVTQKQLEITSMTRTQWWFVGAVLLGLAVAVYLLFFCPTECQ
ncbi:MAG: hypothetical protein Q8L77_15530 [Nitrospirota bacterium]|nr:hypothetical protein [Nitrospirota bacterium]